MEGGEAGPEEFAGLEKMAHIGGGVAFGEGEDAVRVYGAIVPRPARTSDVDAAAEGVEAVVASHARGKNAVEHIDAVADGVKDVARVADTHEVAGFVLGEMRSGGCDDGVLKLGGFANADASDGVSSAIVGADELKAFLAQVGVDAALDDPEDTLSGSGGAEISGEPEVGEPHGVFGFGAGAGVGRADIESHGDVHAELTLDLDAALGSEF